MKNILKLYSYIYIYIQFLVFSQGVRPLPPFHLPEPSHQLIPPSQSQRKVNPNSRFPIMIQNCGLVNLDSE